MGAHFWGQTGVQIQPPRLNSSWPLPPRDSDSLCLSFSLCAVGTTLVRAEECFSTISMDDSPWPRAGHTFQHQEWKCGGILPSCRAPCTLLPSHPRQGQINTSHTHSTCSPGEKEAPKPSPDPTSVSLASQLVPCAAGLLHLPKTWTPRPRWSFIRSLYLLMNGTKIRDP